MKDEIKEKVDMTIRKVRVAMIKHREGFYDYDMLVCHELDYNEWKNLLDYITNLQQENQDIKDTLQDKLDYIGHLKELCDKYEEEHNTKFNEWVFDKRENERLTQGVTLLTNKLIDMTKEKEDYKSRNKKAIEYIKEMPDEEEYHGLLYDNEEKRDLLNILNGDNK